MNTAEQILVIILATALAVFLVLAIVIASQVIRLMNVLQDIALKGQRLATSAEETAEMVRATVSQLSVFSFLKSLVDKLTGNSTKNSDKGE